MLKVFKLRINKIIGSLLHTDKKYLTIKKYNAISVLFNQQYDFTVRDYYIYCLELLTTINDSPECRCNVILGNYSYKFDNPYPTIKIDLQIEHTLVKPGGRGSEGAIAGSVPIFGSEESSYLVRIANLNYLNKLDVIIDYSRPNIINVRESGRHEAFINKLFHLSPLLYDVKKGLASNIRDLEVITLFGNPDEPRRRNFLNTLTSQGIKCKNINNVFQDVDMLYRRTKILINIRQTDYHDTLEELRILPALRCGVIVISEIAPLKEAIGYSNFILWDNIENLPKLVNNVIRNYDWYRQKIFSGTRFMGRMKRMELRNKIIAAQIGNHIKECLPK
jgi:hypothetical protein